MNYELALQLKNAGFPQTNKGGIFQGDEIKTELPGKAFEMVSDPTLSELIEECGDRFDKLELIQSLDGKTKEWEATGDKYWNGYGSNPKEAVSNLWLAINKK